MFTKLEVADRRVLLQVQRWRNPALTKIFLPLTYSGTGRAWCAFIALLAALQLAHLNLIPEQTKFLHASLAALAAWVLGHPAKKLFSRPRPSTAIQGYEQAIVPPPCGSFPSSHSSSAIGFYAALLLYQHPLANLVGAWAILVSFSRLYLGVHYLSDILGGAMLGILCAFSLQAITQAIG